ncbi:MAG: DUF2934 domain-containing protein [Candidatus Obscuribacterales bacterium]|nr:DUF2934 domain-containing protein [Candidatus Obscuribacterales bacterium]
MSKPSSSKKKEETVGTEKKGSPRKTSSSKVAAAASKNAKESILTATESRDLSFEAISIQEIANRAYLLWVQDAYQHGKDREHWLAAEKQLKSEKTAAAN